MTVVDAEGKLLGADQKIGTGALVKSADGAEFTVVVPGDADGDGRIGAADARKALRAAAKLESLNDAFSAAADVSCDGRTKAADARKILRVAAKLETITTDQLSVAAE